MLPVTTQSFSSEMVSKLEALTVQIQSAPKLESASKAGYFETLKEIHDMMVALFERIALFATDLGFQKVELFEAWPKGICENFVFGMIQNHKITHVILSQNAQWKFLQNGGGKTPANETSKQAAYREAQEEFGYRGPMGQMVRVTTESESSFDIFHFVKGVHIGLVSPAQADELKLGDDIANDILVKFPTAEFLDITQKDAKPIDHGFDRKWIAEFVKEYNQNEFEFDQSRYYVREVTEKDCQIAAKAQEWISKIHVNKDELTMLAQMIKSFAGPLTINGGRSGEWKSKENRDAVKNAAQKVVDVVVSRLLPPWTYQTSKGEKTGCQVKVQEAAGALVNGDPLPSFLTIPQLVAIQKGFSKVPFQFKMTGMTELGSSRNITAVIV